MLSSIDVVVTGTSELETTVSLASACTSSISRGLRFTPFFCGCVSLEPRILNQQPLCIGMTSKRSYSRLARWDNLFWIFFLSVGSVIEVQSSFDDFKNGFHAESMTELERHPRDVAFGDEISDVHGFHMSFIWI